MVSSPNAIFGFSLDPYSTGMSTFLISPRSYTLVAFKRVFIVAVTFLYKSLSTDPMRDVFLAPIGSLITAAIICGPDALASKPTLWPVGRPACTSRYAITAAMYLYRVFFLAWDSNDSNMASLLCTQAILSLKGLLFKPNWLAISIWIYSRGLNHCIVIPFYLSMLIVN